MASLIALGSRGGITNPVSPCTTASALPPTSVTIIERVGGGCRLGAVVEGLAEEFDAPRETISGDVRRMLQNLADQGFLAVEDGHG